METVVSSLTVFFREPFWIGVYERECGGKYEAAQVVFGAEPKDYEVYDLMLKSWSGLKFSPRIEAEAAGNRRLSPKRLRRAISRSLKSAGVENKAWQALKLQQEKGKLQRSILTREEREREKERKFELHREKRREKHRGH